VLLRTRLAGEKTTMGGLLLKILKKLNGLRLSFPSASTVLAKAMGRGPIAALKVACSFTGEISLAIYEIILCFSFFNVANVKYVFGFLV
jgi:hypothetical protein